MVEVTKRSMIMQLNARNGPISPNGILCVATAVLLIFSFAVAANAKPAPGASLDAGDGEASDWAMLRLRRQARSPLSGSAESVQQEQQDEHEFIKRQLTDLIAQARRDRQTERALLKLLIETSLRSDLNDLVANKQQLQPVQQVAGSNGNGLDREQFSALGEQLAAAESGARQADTFAARLARLSESVEPQLAGAEQDNGAFAGALQQNVLNKREYSKPCSFNAISCVRSPFRKF